MARKQPAKDKSRKRFGRTSTKEMNEDDDDALEAERAERHAATVERSRGAFEVKVWPAKALKPVWWVDVGEVARVAVRVIPSVELPCLVATDATPLYPLPFGLYFSSVSAFISCVLSLF